MFFRFQFRFWSVCSSPKRRSPPKTECECQTSNFDQQSVGLSDTMTGDDCLNLAQRKEWELRQTRTGDFLVNLGGSFSFS